MRFAPIALIAFTLACRFPNADQRFGLDGDGDGVAGADDCDDNDADVFPGADEVCNDTDDDCNGDIDDDPVDAATFHPDGDGDGVGVDNGTTATGCEAPDGFAEAIGDCDDADDDRFPGNAEIADDDIDQDCNGDDTITCFTDADHDGWGIATEVLAADGSCDTADGEADDSLDCADNDNTRFPGANEIVGDEIDQNCDGLDTPPCYHDDDLDTFGDATDPIGTTDCAGAGGVTDPTDCDDDDDTIHPDAEEICDGAVNDCGGSLPADETDTDGDDFVACTLDVALVDWKGDPIDGGSDCAASDGTVYPGAPALCDGKVNACLTALPANEIDDDNDRYVECTFATGVTADNWGNVESPTVLGGQDCNDAVGTNNNDGGQNIFPGAPPKCDGRVNACGGTVTDDEVDHDNDTFVECDFETGVTGANWGNQANEDPDVVGGGDCNDTPVTGVPFHPGAFEHCNDIDEDCDEESDATDDDAAEVITFEPAAGSPQWVDVTPVDPTERVTYAFDEDGTARLCPGVHHVKFVITTDEASVIGRYGATQLTTLSGIDPDTLNPVDRMIDIQPDSGVNGIVVQDLTLRDGLGTVGNTEGGAARVETAVGTVEFNDCTFVDNDAQWGGAIDIVDGTVDFNTAVFETNHATGDGGALYIDAGDVDFIGAMFDGNDASSDGGALYILDGTVDFTDAVFDGNDADAGGGLYLEAGTFTIHNSQFLANTADNGAGLLIESGTLTFTGTTNAMTSNEATLLGGGIYVDTATITMTGMTASLNQADSGGLAFITDGGAFTTTGTNMIQTNTAATRGGAFRVFNGTLTLGSGTTVQGNSSTGNDANEGGGAISIRDGTLNLTDVDILNNTAPGQFGGGILADGTGGFTQAPTININAGTVISGNSASLQGGGVACRTDCVINVTSATITNNTVMNAGATGGGVMLGHASAQFNCTGGTIKGNTAPDDALPGEEPTPGGGVQINAGSNGFNSVESTNCDWGASGQGDNMPSDVATPTISVNNKGVGATFQCDIDSCN